MKEAQIIRTRLVWLKKELKHRRDWIEQMRKTPSLMDEADKEIFKDYVKSDKVLDNEVKTLEWVLKDD